MGCNSSKANGSAHFHAESVDDSIHAMLQREERLARMKGGSVRAYRPPAPHPLLQRAHQLQISEDAVDDRTSQESLSVDAGEVSNETTTSNIVRMHDKEIQQLLFHTKHHCDTIDRRDVSCTRREHRITAGTR